VSDAARFERCIRSGGVALFPSDTVYGLACDPLDESAVARLYEIKRRPPEKAAAVMFFELGAALAALPELGERTREALARLMPGGVTVLLANPARRFPLASRADPATLGLRVVSVPALAGVRVAVLQSSANLSGGPDARRLADVDPSVRAAVDLQVDGGELPGVASTVIDLRRYEHDGSWSVVRPGAVGEGELAAALSHQLHFQPATYAQMIRDDIPAYDELQERVVSVLAPGGVRRILDLGTGTGETARRLLERHAEAILVGIDESSEMLAAARNVLAPERADLHAARLQDRLPAGPFDLVVSVLCVHHLDSAEKRDLFGRIRDVLVPAGWFVLGDVVVPDDPGDVLAPLTPGYDRPSRVQEQLGWLQEASFSAEVVWRHADLAVIAAQAPA
jgi:L-threonylcarbamoyladenylate synthase